MSISLIESKRQSQKSVRSTMVSVALHAAVISLAVYATASAGEVIKTHDEITTPIYSPPHAPTKPESPRTPAKPGAPAMPTLPDRKFIEAPITIPDKLPPVDPTSGLAPAESLFTIGDGGKDPANASSGSGIDSGDPLSAAQVDKPALPRSGNPNPRYPTLLESSRIEGVVLAKFVVDTLGRADISTFKILDSSNDLFSASLRTALAQWRFFPAEAGGRKVNQIVQLPLKFIAPNH